MAELAFTLALPAFAEDPDPAMPVITKQPQGGRIKPNKTLTLSVQASIPNGDEIGYQWWCVHPDGKISRIDTTAETTHHNAIRGTYSYYVEVYNRANPENKVTSETVQVEVLEPTRFEYFLAFMGFFTGYFFGVIFPGMLLAPFYILYQWVIRLFQ